MRSTYPSSKHDNRNASSSLQEGSNSQSISPPSYGIAAAELTEMKTPDEEREEATQVDMTGPFQRSFSTGESPPDDSASGHFLPPAYGLDFVDHSSAPIQRVADAGQQPVTDTSFQPTQPANNTGLPDNLKAGVESLSGYSMDDVKVFYNSSRPAQINALAYAQGTDIHLGPGQERHLPHEAWHVVQQKEGRVRGNLELKGSLISEDSKQENEAIVMGKKAARHGCQGQHTIGTKSEHNNLGNVVQRALIKYEDIESSRDATGRAQLPKTFDDIETVQSNKVGKGLGAKDGQDIEHKTEIKWGPLDEEMDGTWMKARLGPDHKKGSEPGTQTDAQWVKKRKQLSSAAGGHRYIAGHLLNHELGGPGNLAENLTAIPEEINKKHSSEIEEFVKEEVNIKGVWGFYEVETKHTLDNNANPNVRYANELKASWKPIGISNTDENGDPVYNEVNKSGQVSLELPIPAPSEFRNKSQVITSNKAKKPDVSSPNLAATPLVTPFQFDETPLTSFTSKISRYAIDNVRLINKLQGENKLSKEELDELKHNLKTRTEVLRKELGFVYAELFDAYESIQDLKNDFGRQQIEFEDLLEYSDQDFGLLTEKLNAANAKLMEFQAQFQDQKDELERLNLRLQEKEDENRELHQEVYRQRETINDLEDQNKSLRENIIRLQQEIRGMKRENPIADSEAKRPRS